MGIDKSNAPGSRLAAIAPLVPALFVFGISFGAVATTAGFSLPAALVMSATTFGGAAQMAAATTLAAGGGAAGAILTGVLLNLRYLPMGITAAHAYPGPWWRRGALAQLLGDETWAISRTPDGGHDGRLLILSGATVYVVWLTGTALGAVGVQSIGDVRVWGLDMVSPAIFFALLWKQLDAARARVAAAGAAVIALIPLAQPGVSIALACLVCLIGLAR